MRVAAVAMLVASLGVRASAEVPTGQPVSGIRCDTMEGSVFHIHQHLTILDHGKPVTVPADVGRPALAACFYWLHTHTDDGLIHVESPKFQTFTLGQFFDVWGQPLNATTVATVHVPKGQLHVWVDGRPYTGDPRKIGFAQHTDITLEAGPPYSKPVPFTDWQGQ